MNYRPLLHPKRQKRGWFRQSADRGRKYHPQFRSSPFALISPRMPLRGIFTRHLLSFRPSRATLLNAYDLMRKQLAHFERGPWPLNISPKYKFLDLKLTLEHLLIQRGSRNHLQTSSYPSDCLQALIQVFYFERGRYHHANTCFTARHRGETDRHSKHPVLE